MSPRTLVVVQRLALLAAILASAALIIDYQNIGDPTFCGADSPCFKVRASEVGKGLAGMTASLGMTVPHVGVLAHVVLLALSLAATTRTWLRVVAAAATGGALCAIFLLVVQARLGELCPWCAVVDASSLIAAAASVMLARRATIADEAPAWGREAQTATAVVVWSAAAAAMVALPHVWARNAESAPLPPQILALQEPGKVTIISFTDFECPFCRKLSPTLTALHDDPKVAFKRLMAPLDMHPGATPAALAYLCVPDDKKDAFAELLYEAPDGSFSVGNLVWMARKKAGLPDEAAFLKCMGSPETKAKLDRETAIFKDSGGTGLPTTWVGKRVVKGFRPEQVLRALDSEKAGSGVSLPIWSLFLVAAAIAAWTAAMHVRAAKALSAALASADKAVKAYNAPGRDDEETDADVADAPPKAARKPAKTAAASPLAKRKKPARPAPPEDAPREGAGDDAPPPSDPGGEPKVGDVVASAAPDGAPDPTQGTGEKT